MREDADVTELLERARAGDGKAFGELVEPYRRELHVHCYRILGSVQDAEDLTQETLLAAWRGLEQFEGRASVRAWLYRIATNRCLNALRDGKRRPPEVPPGTRTVGLPEPTRVGEPSWLQPFPDLLLDGLPDTTPGPEARYETNESISLAFIASVQSLPPRQRVVLVLRDVLGFPAAEVADMLETTEDSVTSALRRARAAIADDGPDGGRGRTVLPDSRRERELAGRFAEALEQGEVEAMVRLLTDDAWLRMPPLPLQYQGRARVAGFMATIVLRGGTRRYRLVPTRANRQPAYGCYGYDGNESIGRARGLMVLTVTNDGISTVTQFLDNSLLPLFGLPRTLRD